VWKVSVHTVVVDDAVVLLIFDRAGISDIESIRQIFTIGAVSHAIALWRLKLTETD
jgi:hypothetical protein